jgi:hypothetical protein
LLIEKLPHPLAFFLSFLLLFGGKGEVKKSIFSVSNQRERERGAMETERNLMKNFLHTHFNFFLRAFAIKLAPLAVCSRSSMLISPNTRALLFLLLLPADALESLARWRWNVST